MQNLRQRPYGGFRCPELDTCVVEGTDGKIHPLNSQHSQSELVVKVSALYLKWFLRLPARFDGLFRAGNEVYIVDLGQPVFDDL